MDKIFEIINNEQKRQDNTVELIASENFVSDRVKQAVGSCMMLKYTEGYPSKESIAKFQEKYPDYVHTGNMGRYYGGVRTLMNSNYIAAICGKKYLRLIIM